MSLRVYETIPALRAAVASARASGAVIGLVPTMGALHAGHGSLIQQSARECGLVAVSIFVNPIQFNQPDDLAHYPRTLEADLDFCRALGVHAVFAPSEREMYPHPPSTFVNVTGVSERLCGEFRPGHFRGVATVVLKLLLIAQPDRAYFGEKDAQQLAVIRRMARDLNVSAEIVEVPTVRESDGLALSSRNRRLTPQERAIAPALYRALRHAAERIARGQLDPAALTRTARAEIEAAGLRVEYVEIVDPEEMQPVEEIRKPVRIAAAAWLGATRLIDNLLCTPGGGL